MELGVGLPYIGEFLSIMCEEVLWTMCLRIRWQKEVAEATVEFNLWRKVKKVVQNNT